MRFVLESSWDDGTKGDLRLADLLKKYSIPATFYIAGNTELQESEIVLLAQDFEIGSHTLNHPQDIKLLSAEQQSQEIELGIDFIEDVLGVRPKKFAYPRGRYDLRTIEALKKLGVTEARTTVIGELSVEDPFKKHTSVHVGCNRKEYGGLTWLEFGRKMLKRARNDGGILHIWGHSREIEKNGFWHETELYFKEIHEVLHPQH